jgi:hypothetical protein
VVADSAGLFGEVFLSDAVEYKVVLKTAADVTVWTADPVSSAVTALSGSIKAIHLSDTASDLQAITSKLEFLESGTGAVSRTVTAKLRDQVSVKGFGAVGDGVTTDTAAFALATTASAFVFVPVGTYVVGTSTLALAAQLYGPGTLSCLGTLLPVGNITSDVTLPVPTVFSDINAALNYLNNKSISADATVTISVAAGTHDYNATSISINHPDGDRLRIVGSGKATCTLRITGSAAYWEANSFITLEGGERLGYLNGVTLDGNNQLGRTGGFPGGVGAAANAQGILLRRDCYMKLGPDVLIKNFARCGILAYQGCTMLFEGSALASVTVQDCGSDGVVASAGSNIYAQYTLSQRNMGYGFFADQNAFLDCRNASAIDGVGTAGPPLKGGGGMIAIYDSTIFANNAIITGNASTGLQANTGSVIIADGATITGNGTNATATTRYGIYVVYGSDAYLDDAVVTGNYLSGVAVSHNSSAYGARLSATGNNVSATADEAGIKVTEGSCYSGGSVVASTNTGSGIRIETGSTGTVNGITASSNTVYGMLITGAAQAYFDDATVLSNGSSGVYIDLASIGTSARLESRLNGVSVASQAGLYVISGSHFAGGGIVCSNNTGTGAIFAKGSDGDITQATLSSNSAQGLNVSMGHVNVSSGTIQSNATTGVFAGNSGLVDATSATISLNTVAQTSPATNTSGTRNAYIHA